MVGSMNPAKLEAVKSVLDKEYSVQGMTVPSHVSAQPMTDVETKEGAMNRAYFLVKEAGADIGIGLEGGVIEEGDEMYLCNWGALATREGRVFIGGGARIPLPAGLAKKVRRGRELGDVIDAYTGLTDVRKGDGTVGILTSGLVSRADMFSHVVKLVYGQYLFHKQV